MTDVIMSFTDPRHPLDLGPADLRTGDIVALGHDPALPQHTVTADPKPTEQLGAGWTVIALDGLETALPSGRTLAVLRALRDFDIPCMICKRPVELRGYDIARHGWPHRAACTCTDPEK